MSEVYFAFGSNMRTSRLRGRCPSAISKGIGHLSGFVLRFNKRSRDGSGKANVVRSKASSDKVWGVLFELSETDLKALDRAEGDGYLRKRLEVLNTESVKVAAWVYVAVTAATEDQLRPTAEYLELVVSGAKEFELPPAYVRQLEAVRTCDTQTGSSTLPGASSADRKPGY